MVEKFGFTIDEACAFTGISRRMIYNAIKDGDLVRRKMGKRTLLIRSELEAFLLALPKGSSASDAKPT